MGCGVGDAASAIIVEQGTSHGEHGGYEGVEDDVGSLQGHQSTDHLMASENFPKSGADNWNVMTSSVGRARLTSNC
jgi:hypothetical protein